MKHNPRRLVISLVPTYTRILNAITVTILSASLIAFYSENGVVPILAIAIGISLLFLCYEERWVFDSFTEEVIFRNGLLFIAKRKKISFTDIESVSCMEFEKGFRKTKFTRIVVIEKNGTETVLASVPTEKQTTLIKQARDLESFFSK